MWFLPGKNLLYKYCLQLSYLRQPFCFIHIYSCFHFSHFGRWMCETGNLITQYPDTKVNLLPICRTAQMCIFWTAVRNISHSSSLFSLQVFIIWLMKNHIRSLTEILFHVLSKGFFPKLESNYRRWFKEHRSWEKQLKSMQPKIYCLIFEVISSGISFQVCHPTKPGTKQHSLAC